MITLTRLNAMNLKVRDLDAALAWYHTHFGFTPRYAVEGGIVIAVNDIELVLSPHDNPDAPLADPRACRCIHTLGFEVSAAEFQAVKAEFAEDADHVEIDQPEFSSLIVSDPDGYCVEVFYNQRRTS
ncbi:MAG TPA: VOC family protein [Armatimonadota bacterium]|nr:VOC family protein [Armatimonadota bacterium]